MKKTDNIMDSIENTSWEKNLLENTNDSYPFRRISAAYVMQHKDFV